MSKPIPRTKAVAAKAPLASISNVESEKNHPAPEEVEQPHRTSYLHKLTQEEQKEVREKVGRGELHIMGPDSLIVIP